jgi:hypothetical protein
MLVLEQDGDFPELMRGRRGKFDDAHGKIISAIRGTIENGLWRRAMGLNSRAGRPRSVRLVGRARRSGGLLATDRRVLQ